MTVHSFGRWPSPITPELVASQGARISDPQAVADRLYWLETRPQEKGRNVLMCEQAGSRKAVFESPISVRTRAQEYGGSSYLATDEFIFYVQDDDQRIYQYDIRTAQTSALTPAGALRYADFCFDATRQHLLAVQEDCTLNPHNPDATLIAINVKTGTIMAVASGADFYSNPRLSPDGRYLSYLRWFHPKMPWDATECVVAQLDAHGNVLSEMIVAGGAAATHEESIFQPQWSPNGDLFFVSDRNNWWNIYRWDKKTVEAICPLDAEFATPQWVFGMSTYGFLNEQTIFCCYSQQGYWHLGLIDINQKTLQTVPSDFRDIAGIHCKHNRAYFVASTTTSAPQLWVYDCGETKPVTAHTHSVDAAYIAPAVPITFPTRDGAEAHGFFYAPTNGDVTSNRAVPSGDMTSLADCLPPLIVMCHGGPTGATETGLNFKIQFWTSRGFAVLDVNYRGSTGYGRRYRDQLKNNWGVTDVIDVCSGVDYLMAHNLVDGTKVAIRGSSAGGYTVLAALTFTDSFTAGASLYGIGDLEALAKDTHKFEAHYLDSLIGKYPEDRETYRARSPIHHIDKLNCSVIFLQGLQDKVVPPSQAEAMVAALKTKGIVTEYVVFPEEGHGFRQGQNIQRALEAELDFYLAVFDQK